MHFFIDHTKLPDQDEADQYGPVVSESDPEIPKNQYNVTSRFLLPKKAKAFACEAGMIIVQQSVAHDSLVNVILKPDSGTVAYYIYRGILKSSLMSGVFPYSIITTSENTTGNELISRIRRSTGEIQLTTDIIGFPVSTTSDHVERIFSNPPLLPVVRSISVVEGESFGTFATTHKIGFEIITEPDKLNVTFDFVAQAQTIVNVTDREGLDLRSKREEILCFIDPVAFFGSYTGKSGVGRTTYDDNNSSTSKKFATLSSTNIYSLLTKFKTTHRVYLDIRSERGYSYNFYQNYAEDTTDFSIKIGHSENSLTAKKYESDSWPIIFFDGLPGAGRRNVYFQLRIDDNTRPIIYVADLSRKTSNFNQPFIPQSDILGTSMEWSNTIRFLFPAVNLQLGEATVGSYLKLYYFRQAATTLNTTLRTNKYFDLAFCPIDLPDLVTVNQVSNGFTEHKNINFITELAPDGTVDFAYAASNGVYWNTNRVLFYSVLKTGIEDSGKTFVKTYSKKININNKFGDRWKNLEVICRPYVKSPSTNINILGVNYYGTVNDDQNVVSSFKEDVLFLGLTQSELSTVLSAANGLSTKHHRYIFLVANSSNPLRNGGSATGNKFYEYTIHVKGLNDDEEEADLPTSVLVYSRDNLFFNSILFGAGETPSPGLDQVEYHIYNSGCIRLNDNIDLSLFGIANTVTNELEREIYYKYHTANQPVREVCHLHVHVSSRMQKGSSNATLTQGNGPLPPAGYNQSINYVALAASTTPPTTGVHAVTSYENASHDIITVGNPASSRRYYKNLKKKVFLVHFDKTRVNGNAALNINFNYFETLRHYADPSLAAAVMGALIEIGATGIVSTGFSFRDGTCFPSTTHVNGEAIDTLYQGFNQNQAIINAYWRFGFDYILKGPDYLDPLTNTQPSPWRNLTIATADDEHDDHLHSGGLKLNIRNNCANLNLLP